MYTPTESDLAFEVLTTNLPFVKRVVVYENAMAITRITNENARQVKDTIEKLCLPLFLDESISGKVFEKNTNSAYVKFISSTIKK